jgi:hypothetical protein
MSDVVATAARTVEATIGIVLIRLALVVATSLLEEEMDVRDLR